MEAPSWLSDSKVLGGKSTSSAAPAPAAETVQPATPTTPTTTTSSLGQPKYKTIIKFVILFFDIGFMVMMSTTGALAISNAQSIEDTNLIFVGLYMIFFAAILTTYEITQIRPCGPIDNFYKRNFGFLYGTIGKCCFIIFMAILSFGISNPQGLAIANGVLVMLWGCVQLLLYFQRPEYFDKKDKYVPE